MSAHSLFSPSSAHRWIPCPGSIALCEDIPPQPSSEFADEGTAAHELLAWCLANNRDSYSYPHEGITVNGKLYVPDEEMLNSVRKVADSVFARVAGGWTLLIEQRVDFSRAIGVPGQKGTADIILISPDGTHVSVEDFKYGKGVQVYASYQHEGGRRGNDQLMTYAVGVAETFSDIYGPFKKFTVRVHQPRIDWDDEYECTVDDVAAHADVIRLAAAAAMAVLEAKRAGQPLPADAFTPGEHQCRFCPAKATCEALAAHVSKAVYDDFEVLSDPARVYVSAPKAALGERMGAMYTVLDTIEDWCRSVRAEVTRMVTEGMTVVGADGLPMKLIAGRRGARQWVDEGKAEAMLTGVLPPEKAYVPRKIISVSQAAKLLDKAKTRQQWEHFKENIRQPPGSPKVALGSDPAPAYVPSASEDEFDDCSEGGE